MVKLLADFRFSSQAVNSLIRSSGSWSSQHTFLRQASWKITFARIATGLTSPSGSYRLASRLKTVRFVTFTDFSLRLTMCLNSMIKLSSALHHGIPSTFVLSESCPSVCSAYDSEATALASGCETRPSSVLSFVTNLCVSNPPSFRIAYNEVGLFDYKYSIVLA